ncbi:MAG: ribosome biogenesis GTPase Der [Patescibacteria group bacterium]|nr:ribosome biogenesis GTPase Der [Patescibacteria group bacterium]
MSSLSPKTLPIVAIVGQPNAGKSTLLNKISGNRLAVTSPVPGTTRDRQYADTSWNGVNFTLVDTAGLSLDASEGLERSVNEQIQTALDQADTIIFLVDGRLNRASVDQPVLRKFRKIPKPVLLAVNKLESISQREEKLAEFRSLGIKPIFPVSALNGSGIGDMLDYLADTLRPLAAATDKERIDRQLEGEKISVAIVGKPNVGKSSIFNRILEEERVVVSPVPGTTRTAIDSEMEAGGQKYTFIDTAGLKKKEYRQQQPDIYAGFQTFKSIRRSDVCLFVIDASEPITKQDQRVAAEIFSQEKGCIILATKIDLYPDDRGKLQDYISLHFPFLWMCPVFFVSGKTGESLDEAVAGIKPIFARRQKKVDNQTLSEFLNRLLKKNPPKLLRDQKKPKVFSLHQTGVNPPHFELLVNHPAAISQQFRKFAENSIIKNLDFWGTPIVLRLRGKDKA